MRLFGLAVAVVVVATLYFARVVFMPLALALLFSLVLTPPVIFLERVRFPRIVAILLVVLVLVGLLGVVAWRTSRQFVEVMDQLPAYQDTIEAKIQSLREHTGKSLSKASSTVKELRKVITGPESGAEPGKNGAAAAPEPSPSRPVPVEVVPPVNPIGALQNVVGPLGTAGLVIVFTIFILAGRESLRNRLIRLAAGGQLTVMTQAIDEANRRINRYLLLQFLVNSGYGAVIGIALHFIGVPHFWLWGVCTAILRFLPYIGAPLAASMPILLSLAVFPGWHQALLTAGVFLAVELTVANLVEPFLYGAHVGLSPLAILVAAIFWTLIWGFPGLVLSTPLTVCLVVMGRHIPHLAFLSVLFGDAPVLPPPTKFYQRLLAGDQVEARQILEDYLKEHSMGELYSSLIIPALGLAEQDRHRNDLDETRQNLVYQSTRELIEELADASDADTGEENSDQARNGVLHEGEAGGSVEVLCIPARDEADEIVGTLVARMLERSGHTAQALPIGMSADMLAQVAELKPALVCISALPPFAVEHARTLYLRLRVQFPRLDILVCVWHFEGDLQRLANRLKLAAGHALYTALPQVLQHVALRSQQLAL